MYSVVLLVAATSGGDMAGGHRDGGGCYGGCTPRYGPEPPSRRVRPRSQIGRPVYCIIRTLL